MKGLTLTTKEQTRIQVLNGVIEGKVTVAEASGLMGVSERHAWRLLAAYRGEGPAAVAHGNRGRKPATTTCPQTREKVRELAEGPLRRIQPHPSDRDAGGARGYPSVSLYREAGPAGWRTAQSPSPQSTQAILSTGALSRRRGCCCRSTGAGTTGWRAEDPT